MENRIIIATHGKFAEGIYNSLAMIAGDQSKVEYINCYSDTSLDYSLLIKEKVASHHYATSNLLVITDLLGGSVNNEFMRHIKQFPFYLVAGLNLGMLLEFTLSNDELSEQMIECILCSNKEGILLCNQCLTQEEESDF